MFSLQWFAFNPRKAFLHLGCHSNHLVGIGGPGAPHEFYFQRAQDLGNLVVEDDDLDGNVGDVVDVVDVVVVAGSLFHDLFLDLLSWWLLMVRCCSVLTMQESHKLFVQFVFGPHFP